MVSGVSVQVSGFCDSPSSPEKPGKIPNLKHQITNKSQISIFNDQTGAAMPHRYLCGLTPIH
jgi:hypothetical protein